MSNTYKQKYITSKWELRTYDVWGNAKDGYEVNDCWRAGTVELRIPVKTYNENTPGQFDSATPTDKQIRAVFGLTNIQLDTDGDDLTIYVNRARDSKPLGEMNCVSHASLSPIREVNSNNNK